MVEETLEASKGRDMVGLSESEDEADDEVLLTGVTAVGTLGGCADRRYRSFQKNEPLHMEKITVVFGHSQSHMFRVVEPVNVRGFRVEATADSVLKVLDIARSLWEELDSKPPKAPEAASWMTKRKASVLTGDTASLESLASSSLESLMRPIHGKVQWDPARKAWRIYYNKSSAKDADRKVRQVSVKHKDAKTGADLPRQVFIQKKYAAYRLACGKWDELDQTSRHKILLDADVDAS